MLTSLSETLYVARTSGPQPSARAPVAASALALCALILGLFRAAPAHASESEASGVVVGAEETTTEVAALDGATVNGAVEGGVSAVFGPVLINGPVGGDVRSGFGAVRVRSPVGGDVDAGFGDMYIDSRVYGDVDVGRGTLLLGPNARVYGHVSIGDGGMRRAVGSAVDGAVMFGAGSAFAHLGDTPILPGRGSWLIAALLLAACGALAGAVAPGALAATAREAEKHPG